MPSLKEIRNRIQSVASTTQITNAMKMVSAAKLRRSQEAAAALRPYSDKIGGLIRKITAFLQEGNIHSPYAAARPVKKTLLIVITSNRGLCGALNSNVIKEALRQIKSKPNAEVSVATIGKKGHDILGKTISIIFNDNQIYADLTFQKSEEIAEKFMEAYRNGVYDEVTLIYSHFVNAATQKVLVEPFLPIQSLSIGAENSQPMDYLFEPSKVEILETLIPKALKIQFFKALRDSVASEHGARMTAMHKATDNANEIKAQLTLTYNKARQATITSEILEIVGGAEALKGG